MEMDVMTLVAKNQNLYVVMVILIQMGMMT